MTILEGTATPVASRLLQDKVQQHPKMTVLTETSLTRFTATEGRKLAEVTIVGPDGISREHQPPARSSSSGSTRTPRGSAASWTSTSAGSS